MPTLRQKNRRMERQLETKCVQWAKGNGWMCLKMNVMGQRGWPDRLFVKGGNAVFVEFKAPSKKPDKLQANMLKSLREEGMYAFWNSDLTEFIESMLTIEGGISHEGSEGKTIELIHSLRLRRNEVEDEAQLTPMARAEHTEHLFKMELEALNMLYQCELVEIRVKMPPVMPQQRGEGGGYNA